MLALTRASDIDPSRASFYTPPRAMVAAACLRRTTPPHFLSRFLS